MQPKPIDTPFFFVVIGLSPKPGLLRGSTPDRAWTSSFQWAQPAPSHDCASPADIGGALDRGGSACADVPAELAPRSCSGCPAAADLLVRLSGGSGAAITAVIANRRVTAAAGGSVTGLGIFPHGSALRRMAGNLVAEPAPTPVAVGLTDGSPRRPDLPESANSRASRMYAAKFALSCELCLGRAKLPAAGAATSISVTSAPRLTAVGLPARYKEYLSEVTCTRGPPNESICRRALTGRSLQIGSRSTSLLPVLGGSLPKDSLLGARCRWACCWGARCRRARCWGTRCRWARWGARFRQARSWGTR